MTLYHFDIVIFISLSPIGGLNNLIKLIDLIKNYYTLTRVTIKYKETQYGIYSSENTQERTNMEGLQTSLRRVGQPIG